MNIEGFKWISVIIVGITTFIGNSLVLCLNKKSSTSKLESLAGGVFLGAGLAHLLDDAFNELYGRSNYPIAAAVCLATFMILSAIEMYTYSERDAANDNNMQTDNEYSETPDVEVQSSSGTQQTPQRRQQKRKFFGETNQNLTVATISLYLIMDVHSFIEGLAMGIMNTWGALIALFCAVVGHKPVEALALSVIILKNKPTKTAFWIMVVIYALMAPAGIITGIFLLRSIQNQLVLGIISSFSAGTFLYVGVDEWHSMFIHKGDWSTKDKNWHFLLYTAGLVWMLLIAIVEAYSN